MARSSAHNRQHGATLIIGNSGINDNCIGFCGMLYYGRTFYTRSILLASRGEISAKHQQQCMAVIIGQPQQARRQHIMRNIQRQRYAVWRALARINEGIS